MGGIASDGAQYARCGDQQRRGEAHTQQQRADGRSGEDRHQGGSVEGRKVSDVSPPTADFLIQVMRVPVTSVVFTSAPSRHIVALRTPMATAVNAISAFGSGSEPGDTGMRCSRPSWPERV
ncbi:hypothetical protein [Streptomyces sp. HD]|uniref:hypothetical protein n=1 Tax=Streptomyces sp. HD TaxID=3020892 RepID=UPI00232C90A7|nr:hypothetical protein [Streptomyces sp. HD]MDC0772454.1 hypothetical protein [Streptomyces sp. HD]